MMKMEEEARQLINLSRRAAETLLQLISWSETEDLIDKVIFLSRSANATERKSTMEFLEEVLMLNGKAEGLMEQLRNNYCD